MSGIYIPDIEIPKEEPDGTMSGTLLLILSNGKAQIIRTKEIVDVISVPQHGRLIDADALMLKILDYIDEYSDVDEKGWHNLKWCAMKETEMAINNAPTIIPAEEGET